MAVSARSAKYPFLGLGLRLQREYLPALLERRQPVDWLEIISDSWIFAEAPELYDLERIETIVLRNIRDDYFPRRDFDDDQD